ncbi:MAG: hypothetical protein HY370_06765 [Proteobacteria bacterium]|nr:hypothetical protein [Pseudomonadota bacterium]
MDGGTHNVRCEKQIELAAGSPAISIRYRIENLEPAPLHFLFKQHLAIAATPAHRLELPGGQVTPVDRDFGTRLGSDVPFPWPRGQNHSGETVDLSVLTSPEDRQREFVYVEELPEGWCGVRNHLTGRSLRLEFSRETFPYTWLFMTYGGWRSLYTAVLEPCTNMPKDLDEAFRLGRCARLEPNAFFETSVRVVLA